MLLTQSRLQAFQAKPQHARVLARVHWEAVLVIEHAE